jgi:hypothetical protein
VASYYHFVDDYANALEILLFALSEGSSGLHDAASSYDSGSQVVRTVMSISRKLLSGVTLS